MNDKIIEVASRLFLERGIRAVSMDDIAQALGMSKRTLYENFSSKDELLVRCFEWIHTETEKEHRAIGDNGSDVLDIMTRHLFLTIKQLKMVSIAFLQDMNKMCKPNVSDKFREGKEDNKHKLAELIAQGQRDGLVRTDINPELLIGIFIEQGQTIKEIYATGKFTMEDIFMNIFVTYLRGACTPKGIERMDNLIDDFNRSNS